MSMTIEQINWLRDETFSHVGAQWGLMADKDADLDYLTGRVIAAECIHAMACRELALLQRAKGSTGKPYETIMTGALSEIIVVRKMLEKMAAEELLDLNYVTPVLARLSNAEKILGG